MALNLPIVSKFDSKGTDEADSALSRLGGVAHGIGVAAAAAFAAAGAAAIAFGASSLKAASDAEEINRLLTNAISNSDQFGNAEGIKKANEELDKHSTKLAELTGIDDELLNSQKAHWLAVPQLAALGTDGINKLAQVTADVAKGTGRDVESIGNMFIKTAGSSETAMSKLLKAGVVLSDSQKQTYNDMLAVGDEAGAQAYLIDQLGVKYKGAAEAAANPFERLKVIMENLQETVGGAMLPAVEKLVPIIADFVTNLTSSPEFQAFMEALSVAFDALLQALLPLLPVFMDMITALLPPLVEVITLLAPLVGDVAEAFAPLIPIIADLALTLLPPLVELVSSLVHILIDNPQFMDSMVQGFEDLHKIVEPVAGFLGMIADFLGQIGNKKTVLDGLEARVRSTMTAVNPFSLSQSSWMASGGTLNTGKKPFAMGGIVTSATSALIGEAGAEAVIPLDRLPEMIGLRGQGTQTTNLSINVNAGLGTDGAALGEQIVTAIRRYERTSGRVFAAA